MKMRNSVKVTRVFATRIGVGIVTMIAVVIAVGIQVAAPGALRAQEAARAMAMAEDASPLDERERAVHLLQRATFGPRPQDIDRVLAMGIDAWLDEQLHPMRIADPTISAVAAAFPSVVTPLDELLKQYPPGSITQPIQRLAQDESLSEQDRQRIRQQLQGTNPNSLLNDLVGARLYRSAYSERQLEELMTQFWFDHFNVFFRKNQVSWLTGDYEASAIRPNVFGSFYDLLVATASHPAMLYYLDNAQSVAPDSSLASARLRQLSAQFGNIGTRMGRGGGARGGRGAFPPRTGAGGRLGAGATYEDMLLDSLRILQQQQNQARVQGRGLNENYARELLELHTLGVDGGYTQEDVVQVARAFTGWGVTPANARGGAGGRGGRAGQADQVREMALAGTLDLQALTRGMDFSDAYRFEFRPFLHDAGEKAVLGTEIPAGGGVEDGLAVLELLSSHPSTARFIASQMAKRFVSDDPPEALVAQLERVFLETEGDLAAVTKALFTSELFYQPEIVNARVKSPFTLLASAVRLTGAQIVAVRPVIQQLTTLGEVPYMADAPTGYPQESAVWVSSGAMLNRMNLGLDLASGQFRGLRLPGQGGGRGQGRARGQFDPGQVERLAATLLPGAKTDRLIETIREEMARSAEEPPGERTTTVVGLLLGSPEFQRH